MNCSCECSCGTSFRIKGSPNVIETNVAEKSREKLFENILFFKRNVEMVAGDREIGKRRGAKSPDFAGKKSVLPEGIE